MKFGFSILHYQDLDSTLNCVDTIRKYASDSIVVIVDNASPNGSGQQLSERFDDAQDVEIILLSENKGFACGNNIGYGYLKKQDCDFICCINNDTSILSASFTAEVIEEYQKVRFDVMAPKVILNDGSTQSFNPELRTIDYYEAELKKYEESEDLETYIGNSGRKDRVISKYPNVFKKIRKIKRTIIKPYPDRMKNVVLHGCFLIFSSRFIREIDTPFNPRTFMYREEELLYLSCVRNSFDTLYSEHIVVKHFEDASTDMAFPNKNDKYQFIRKNQMDSLRVLIEEMRKNI